MLILDIILLQHHLVRLERFEGLPRIVVRELETGKEWTVKFDEEAYSLGMSAGFEFDTTTIRFTYAAPATLFLTAVANQDGADRTYAMFLPGHYLKKFHPAHAAKEDIDKATQAAGFKTWAELFANRNAPPENPERPTMAAWAPATRASDPVFTLRRNPYYVGVDPAGTRASCAASITSEFNWRIS